MHLEEYDNAIESIDACHCEKPATKQAHGMLLTLTQSDVSL